MLEFLKSITIGDIALTLAFVAGVIGSIAAIGKFCSSWLKKRREHERAEMQAMVATAVADAVKPLQEQLAATEAKVDHMQTELTDNNLQTARLDLMTAIEHTPHEHEAILNLATHYFLQLHGDAWMSGVFRRWATEEKVDISYIADQVPHLKG